MKFRFVFLLCILILGSASAASAEPVKIGMITTLSGGGSGLGIDVRDGFMLAVQQENGSLGGVPVEVLIEDDAQKADKAAQIADRMLKRDEVPIMTGIIWSNLAIAVVPKVVRENVFYISPNAGPSLLAGRGCHENYFNAAWQNDSQHEAMGRYVQDQGYTRVYLLAPNYPAGTDGLAGFKRYYKGEPLAEVYTKLGQTDYATEIAAIRSAAPDAVYVFLPGGMGISFAKQYHQSGLMGEIPLFGPGFGFDQGVVAAVGEAALGIRNASQWSKDMDNAANRKFVADFTATYGRLPSLFASQGYDTARLIGSALAAVNGDMSRTDDFRAALKAAEFDSVRGKFRFGSNNHPIQDYFIREVVLEDGVVTNRIVDTAFTDHQDAYAAECGLK